MLTEEKLREVLPTQLKTPADAVQFVPGEAAFAFDFAQFAWHAGCSGTELGAMRLPDVGLHVERVQGCRAQGTQTHEHAFGVPNSPSHCPSKTLNLTLLHQGRAQSSPILVHFVPQRDLIALDLAANDNVRWQVRDGAVGTIAVTPRHKVTCRFLAAWVGVTDFKWDKTTSPVREGKKGGLLIKSLSLGPEKKKTAAVT